jgi:hypothetical protein
MTTIRWRLARWFAPVPIMRDPTPGVDGVVVLYRAKGVEWAMAAERFRLKATLKLPSLDYGTDDFPTYRPRKPYIRFVGTLGDSA